MPATSEMDVSVVDPESVLVDFQTVEPSDVSGDLESLDGILDGLDDNGKKEREADDKVMVSVRCVLFSLSPIHL